MVTVSLDDPQLAEHLNKLLTSGESEIVLTKGSLLAKFSKVEETMEEPAPLPGERRPLGLWKDIYGPIEFPADFSDELPESFWLGED